MRSFVKMHQDCKSSLFQNGSINLSCIETQFHNHYLNISHVCGPDLSIWFNLNSFYHEFERPTQKSKLVIISNENFKINAETNIYNTDIRIMFQSCCVFGSAVVSGLARKCILNGRPDTVHASAGMCYPGLAVKINPDENIVTLSFAVSFKIEFRIDIPMQKLQNVLRIL